MDDSILDRVRASLEKLKAHTPRDLPNYILPDCPEQVAVLAVWRLFGSILNDVSWLVSTLDGQAWQNYVDRERWLNAGPDGPLNDVDDIPEAEDAWAAAERIAAVDSLWGLLRDPRLAYLPQEPFRRMREVCTADAGQNDAEECEREIEDCRRTLFDHVFGDWGRYWFERAAPQLSDGFFRQAEQQGDLAVLIDMMARPPLVAKSVPVEPLTPLQRAILAKLNGKALKKAPLAAAVCGSAEYGNILYRPGGLNELRKRGLVDWKRGIGFYRPDAPPP